MDGDDGTSSYLKVNMQELGGQLGVRAEELVTALRSHAGALEYGYEVPYEEVVVGGTSARPSRLPSAAVTPSAVPGTPLDFPSSPRNAGGLLLFVHGEEEAKESDMTGEEPVLRNDEKLRVRRFETSGLEYFYKCDENI
jgi:hypothetical protein|eukprot:CAMPEP_0177764836 /NCGR_PEP_ID=MMETSP0491_2-20121128/7637_1 /TAXON_ID=63592 /ORGANISM="Tetraselmis chuii, Strain PLY429" /LENGTH=138 /DNA_ID=CAMNT_0019281077 /DNA_START=424 /DNA_END=840 /DNA_ORIENTATION=-